jgi:hypothetical protein
MIVLVDLFDETLSTVDSTTDKRSPAYTKFLTARKLYVKDWLQSKKLETMYALLDVCSDAEAYVMRLRIRNYLSTVH